MARERIEYDVVIVGAGPAGLAAAIRLKQCAQQQRHRCSVAVVEKGAAIGAHILSGAIMDPNALTELWPHWERDQAPLQVPVAKDRFLWLSDSESFSLPQWLLPAALKNEGNYVVSLAEVCRWLGKQAESLDVDLFPGFAAAQLLLSPEQLAVEGIVTAEVGIGRDGQPRSDYAAGVELHGRYTLFAEGARGNLTRQLIQRFALDRGRDPQSFSLGLKELWEIPAEQHKPGLVIHTAGWPLPTDTYGGGFLYHGAHRQVSIGLVVDLGYSNPYLDPFNEFQRFKQHSAIRKFLSGGRRLAYGARAIATGGLQALPVMSFPGGALIGDTAGLLNVARIKGSHAAIKSGMLAAESAFEALQSGRSQDTLDTYPEKFKASWLYQELYEARNVKPLMQAGLWLGALGVGIDQLLFKGRAPWTLRNHKPDHAKLRPASEYDPIDYPQPDAILSFDRASSVFLSNTYHHEDQPCHLHLKDQRAPIQVNLMRYEAPEQRYCPAGVYEIVGNLQSGVRLQVHAQNCLHCKACDIKDPTQNIIWLTPEGGGGPRYPNL